MRPLRVFCRLASGCVVSTDGIFMLDAILAAEWVRRNYAQEYYNDGGKKQLIPLDLPLATVEIAGRRIYRCSAAQYVCWGEYIAHWHKRLDESIAGRYVEKLGRVVTTRGPYKGYRMPLVVLLIEQLTWYCVGNPEGIKELLSDCRAIGKKRSQGYGMVALNRRGRPAWTVDEWPEDWSIRGPGGRVMRPVPFEGRLEPGTTVRHYGVAPPYWHPANQTLALMPEVGMANAVAW